MVQFVLYVLFRTNRWVVSGENNLRGSIKENSPVLLSTWHSRFLYGTYFLKLKKINNLWAISSTHRDSQIMAYFLQRSHFKLIRGSSTRGWDNVIKQMLRVFKNSNTILAITNDGPTGPRRIAKYGSYKIAKKNRVQIIAVSAISTRFWELNSWDRLKIPKPFGTIYISFSKPMNYENDCSKNADMLTVFLNNCQDELDKKILC